MNNPTDIELSSAPMNLLFVDDEANILKALKRLFRSAEYQIFTAESGAEGLEILSQNPIDLVISDMRMPQMDGAEFLTKAAERWPDTLRILLTGYADLESTVSAVNNGRIYCYCSKPWDDNDLKILINNATAQKRLRDERQQLFNIIHQQNAELKELNTHLAELNASLEEKVEHRTEQLKLSLQKIDLAHGSLKKQYSEAIKAFASIVEMRPGIPSGHSMQIAENARKLAQKLNLDSSETKDIVYAGLLLQIGKMGLPDDLLKQPLHFLSSFDKHRYLQHAQEGWKLLHNIEHLKNAADLILHQYEHFDGSGTPNGLKGKDIPLGSRMLSIIRDYLCFSDGLITGSTLPADQVKERILLRKNNEYDPEIVDTFMTLVSEAAAADDRPIIEISWKQLLPGMKVTEILSDGQPYLHDITISAELISNIIDLHEQGRKLQIRIRE